MQNKIICFLLLIIQLIDSVNGARMPPVTEFSISNITSNVKEWDTDLAIMFYSPLCQYCKQLTPSWEHISYLVSSKSTDVAVGKFNCESSTNHAEICQILGVDRYPSIYFLGYGNINQAPQGNPFGKSSLERMARFTADLYPEAIYDWVRMLIGISNSQRKWDDFTSIFTGNGRFLRKINHLQKELQNSRSKTDSYLEELQRYKAREVFDNIPDNGDSFELLSSIEPDEQNLPLRICVAELAVEYCKYMVKDEDWCQIVPDCANLNMEPKECRPATCPFKNQSGCNVVSSCLKPDVLAEYQRAVDGANAKKSSSGGGTTKAGSGGSGSSSGSSSDRSSGSSSNSGSSGSGRSSTTA